MTDAPSDIDTLAKGGRTNIAGFILRLAARIPFLKKSAIGRDACARPDHDDRPAIVLW